MSDKKVETKVSNLKEPVDENSECFSISKKVNETQKMFDFRVSIYNMILNETKSRKEAKVLSNIIINKLSLQCEYPQDVMNKAKPYFEKISEKDNIWKVNSDECTNII